MATGIWGLGRACIAQKGNPIDATFSGRKAETRYSGTKLIELKRFREVVPH